MNPGRLQGALSLPKTLFLIFAGTILLSLLFYTSWQRLNRKVEDILKGQFNQQQLELARKIADNVEAYFDYLESELLAFPWRFRLIPPGSPEFSAYMQARFQDLSRLGILEIRIYDRQGRSQRVWGPEGPGKAADTPDGLADSVLAWANNPQNRGRLYLGEVHHSARPPWQGRLVMPLLTALYNSSEAPNPYGVLELLIDPLYITGKVTEGVRSGATGYPWIIDQNGIFLSHFEKSFVGEDALAVRLKRNPNIVFRGIKEIHERLFKGEEGTAVYISGWHRQKIAEMEKLAAFTPIRFDKGLIRNVTEVANPGPKPLGRGPGRARGRGLRPGGANYGPGALPGGPLFPGRPFGHHCPDRPGPELEQGPGPGGEAQDRRTGEIPRAPGAFGALRRGGRSCGLRQS